MPSAACCTRSASALRASYAMPCTYVLQRARQCPVLTYGGVCYRPTRLLVMPGVCGTELACAAGHEQQRAVRGRRMVRMVQSPSIICCIRHWHSVMEDILNDDL
eukprot:3234400-Rhodomonas_salina.1